MPEQTTEPIKLLDLVQRLTQLKRKEKAAVEAAGLNFACNPPALGNMSSVRNFSTLDPTRDIDMSGIEKWYLRSELYPADITIPLIKGSNLGLNLQHPTRLINCDAKLFNYVDNGAIDDSYGGFWQQFEGPPITDLQAPREHARPQAAFTAPPTIVVEALSYILEDSQGRKFFLKEF